MIKRQLQYIQEKFFDIFIYSSYILLILSIFGLSYSAPKYLDNLDYYVRIYVCLFLIWRFNPLRSKYEFTELDRKIAFTSGLLILTTTYLNEYILKIEMEAKKVINNFKNGLVN